MAEVWMMKVTRRACPECGCTKFDSDDEDGTIANVGDQTHTCRICGHAALGWDLKKSEDSDDTTIGFYDCEPDVPEGD